MISTGTNWRFSTSLLRAEPLIRGANQLQTLINRVSGRAGQGAADERLKRAKATLESAGISGPVDLIDGAELGAAARDAARRGVKLIIVGGGDGSVSAAAGAIAGSALELAILPMGTLNHFARDLGIPTDLDKAAAVIASGGTRLIDVATLNGQVFVNNSAIGLYPLMVADRDAQQQRLGRSKRLAMVVAGLRTLARFHRHRLTLTIDGEAERIIETPLLFVGNNDYSFELGRAGRRDSITGGHLCVVALRSMGRLGFLAALGRALVGRSRPDELVKFDAVEHLRVDSRRSRLSVSRDGETADVAPPFDFAIRKRALRVIAPPQD